MKTLVINAHPDYKNQSHFSAQLQDLFLKKYNEKYDSQELTVLNIYETQIPKIEEGQLLDIWTKQAQSLELSQEESQIAGASLALLGQFKAHHRIVIVSPLHNFNITSKMKDYLDNILIARETFKYTEKGSVGLMMDNYKALLLLASGGIYTNDDRYKSLDFAPSYLRGMFQEIMGFDDFQLVRAQGTNILPEKEVMEQAVLDLETIFDDFYK